MVPVYGNTLPQNNFLTAVDKMINTLFTFTASGSGWILDTIIELDIKIATFDPIRGSSYIPTPPQLEAPHLLLNIRNRQEHNCFLYCFTAAWHLKYALYSMWLDEIHLLDERVLKPIPHKINQLIRQ